MVEFGKRIVWLLRCVMKFCVLCVIMVGYFGSGGLDIMFVVEWRLRCDV